MNEIKVQCECGNEFFISEDGVNECCPNCYRYGAYHEIMDMKNKKIMTLEDIRKKVKEIEKTAHDDEVAHGKEDALYLEFIEFIANESVSYPRLWLSQMAQEVLKTKNIDFARWYA